MKKLILLFTIFSFSLNAQVVINEYSAANYDDIDFLPADEEEALSLITDAAVFLISTLGRGLCSGKETVSPLPRTCFGSAGFCSLYCLMYGRLY